jgi:hypothetical protein
LIEFLVDLDGRYWAIAGVVACVALKIAVDAWAIWFEWKYPPPL